MRKFGKSFNLHFFSKTRTDLYYGACWSWKNIVLLQSFCNLVYFTGLQTMLCKKKSLTSVVSVCIFNIFSFTSYKSKFSWDVCFQSTIYMFLNFYHDRYLKFRLKFAFLFFNDVVFQCLSKSCCFINFFDLHLPKFSIKMGNIHPISFPGIKTDRTHCDFNRNLIFTSDSIRSLHLPA